MPTFKPLPKRSVVPTGGFSIAQAMDRAPTLGSLLAQHRASQHCLRLAQSALGPSLTALVRAGPLEEGAWTLLVESGQVAAKLKHFLPRVLTLLQKEGHALRDIKVKVIARTN